MVTLYGYQWKQHQHPHTVLYGTQVFLCAMREENLGHILRLGFQKTFIAAANISKSYDGISQNSPSSNMDFVIFYMNVGGGEN